MKTTKKAALGARFRAEVLIPAGLSWDEVAKCDPQERAMFCFLVGAGIPWDEARAVENLDLPIQFPGKSIR